MKVKPAVSGSSGCSSSICDSSRKMPHMRKSMTCLATAKKESGWRTRTILCNASLQDAISGRQVAADPRSTQTNQRLSVYQCEERVSEDERQAEAYARQGKAACAWVSLLGSRSSGGQSRCSAASVSLWL